MQSNANYSNQLGNAFKIIQIKWTSIDKVEFLAKISIKLNKFYVILNSIRVFPFQKVSKNCSKIVLYAGLGLANVLFMINWFSRSSNTLTLFPTNAFVRMLRELAQFTARNSYRTATEWKSKKHKNQIRTNRIEKMDDWTKKYHEQYCRFGEFMRRPFSYHTIFVWFSCGFVLAVAAGEIAAWMCILCVCPMRSSHLLFVVCMYAR